MQGRGEHAHAVLESGPTPQAAGAFAILIEMVPGDLAARVTSTLSVPTVGIGAGNGCDAQVLAWQDMAGLPPPTRPPASSKRYADPPRLLPWTRPPATSLRTSPPGHSRARAHVLTTVERVTMSRPRAFAQVDVFSPVPLGGNPVAVVLDADGLSDDDMQRLARWTNLSETTFVLPPSTERADYRLRIFTPGGELPFAGHPTLGSAHAWLHESGGHSRHPGEVVQECAAGLVHVRIGDVLSFQAPPTLRTGPLEQAYLADVVAALGLDPSQVLAHQWVDNGPGWAVLRLRTADEVLALEPDLSRIPTAMIGVIGAHPAGSPYAFEMRTFAPGVGVPEDPVCGSMNASVGQWLTTTGAAPTAYRVSQGARVGRTGAVTVTADPHGAVWVGGATTTLIRGTLNL